MAPGHLGILTGGGVRWYPLADCISARPNYTGAMIGGFGPSSGSVVAGAEGQHLVGRADELDELSGLIEVSPVAGRLMMVLGEAGIGKSALAEALAGRATNRGFQILSAAGRQSEANLAFSALHQLLRPILPLADDLPERQRQALGWALGTGERPGGFDRLLVGIATLTLLSEASEAAPLLAVVEDVHWLDRSSLDVLEFVGHRLGGEHIVVLATARQAELPASFDRSFPELRLGPLRPADENRLLDTLDPPPRGRARAQVLAQSAGNPLALIELARVIAQDPDAARRWVVTPLPVTERLSTIMATQFAALPDQTQRVLLYAAVADGADLASADGEGLDVDAAVPAERAGLVKIGPRGLQFSHPLVRSAIYHSAPFALRAQAHRQVAAALPGQPDRQAWHLAAAVVGSDEHVARLLEATASQAQRREGVHAAALAMERSAELSASNEERARRFIAAASMAVPTGQADWVQDLASRALAVTTDPQRQIAARRAIGWALVWTSQQAAAVSVLLSVVTEAADRGLLPWAWDALGNAATAANYLGTPAGYRSVRDALDALEQFDRSQLDEDQIAEINDLRLWILASTDRFGSRSYVLPRLRHDARLRQEMAGAAFALDESTLAVELYREAVERLRAPGVRGASGGALMALSLCLYDTGHWDEALDAANEAIDLASAYKMGSVAALAHWTCSMVAARRGDSGAARRHADAGLASVDPEQSATVTAAFRHALGVVAANEGSYLMAFTQLRLLFGADGTPVHIHRSSLGVADMAEAAARAGRRTEGRELLDVIDESFQSAPSPRVERLLALARAQLAEPAEAEAHFEKALSASGATPWTFERAKGQLIYAEWLRRRRRINEAKPVLVEALETFRRLRAQPAVRRAETELRACGVLIEAAPDALAELSPQQRQIVRMASEGLTNREIGDRLFLSARTVSSHLYRCYPKLGVTARHQLRDVIDRAATLVAPPGGLAP
jgi:RNA polymerase sigma factor (sigma-70 family)